MRPSPISALFVLPFIGSCATVMASKPYHRFAPRSEGIEWGACQGSGDGNATCGTFDVPLDWNDSTKGNARLAVLKYPATNQPRKGTLFTNPGGPGEGIDAILPLAPIISTLSGGYYDIVSWDPRGVGQTIPGTINCFNSTAEYNAFWNGTMVDPQMDVRGAFELKSDIDYLNSQVTPMDEHWNALGEKCANGESGQFMPYVGTAAAARDMVALADYLEGNGTMVNYWGFSYGTDIGTYFLGMFPQRVGRVILDGVDDPVMHTQKPAHLAWGRQVVSADETFLGFAEGCAKAGPQGCKISTGNSTGVGIREWMSDLLDLAYDYGKKSDANVTAYAIRSTVFSQLYTPKSWPDLVNGYLWETYGTLNNSGTAIPLAPRAFPSSPTIARREAKQDWPNYLMEAVICGDSFDDRNKTTTQEVFDEIVRVVKEVSPMFGQLFLQAVHSCHKWPFRAVERFQGPFNVTSLSNKVIVIGNRADPTTPYVNAHHVREYLGDNAILIEQNGLGHTSLAQTSDCTQSAVLDYFVNGTLPATDIRCQIDSGRDVLFPKNSAADTKNSAARPDVYALHLIGLPLVTFAVLWGMMPHLRS